MNLSFRSLCALCLLLFTSYSTFAASFKSLPSTPTQTNSFTLSWNKHSSDVGSYTLTEKFNSGSAVQVYKGSGTSKSFSNKAPGTYYYELKGYTEQWFGPEPVLMFKVMDSFTMVIEEPNTAPSISSISNQSINEDSYRTVSFNISDTHTSASSLSVSSWHNNSTLLNSISNVDTSGPSRSIRVTPKANKTGSAVVSVRVSDGTLTTTRTFTVTVNNVNDAPTVSPTAPNQNQHYLTSQVVTAKATASDALDSNGSIQRIEFKLGSSGSWMSDTSSPYQVSFGQLAEGNYTIYYRSRDNSGAYSATASRNISVGIKPQEDINNIPDHSGGSSYSPSPQSLYAELTGKPAVDGGAFSYSMPIPLPPGRAGMQPTVALSYNSQNGKGVAGLGWSLSATESITRCSTIFDIDEKRVNPTYTVNDVLCLNGSRLLLVNGQQGASGSEYKPERDPSIRVKLHNTLTSTSSYFSVQYTDGRIAYFGNTTDSKEVREGHAQTSSWLLSRIEDRAKNKNNVRYTYTRSKGYNRLANIYYTGANGGLGNRRVNFVYQSDTKRINYVWGGKQTIEHKLNEIRVYIGNVHKTTFDLVYETGNADKLHKVSYCDENDSSQCAETEFNWETELFSFTKQNSLDHEINSHLSEFDLDGGYQNGSYKAGLKDILGFPITNRADFDGDGTKEVFIPGKGVRLSGSGEWSDSEKITPNSENSEEINSLAVLPPIPSEVFTGSIQLNYFDSGLDYDGDGREDSIYINVDQKVVIKTAKDIAANSSNVYNTQINGKCYTSNSPIGELTCKSHVADFNGDGRADLLVATNNDPDNPSVNYSVYFRHEEGEGFRYRNSISNIEMAYSYTVLDVDGDGLPDLAQSSFNKELIWYKASMSSNNILSFTRQTTALGFNFSTLDRSYPSRWVDFNGDGLEDVFSLMSFGSNDLDDGKYTWAVAINKGAGQFEAPVSLGRQELAFAGPRQSVSNGEGRVYNQYAKFVDYNNDGRVDVLIPDSTRRKYTYECWTYEPMQMLCADHSDDFPVFSPYDVWYWNVLLTNEDGLSFSEVETDIYGSLAFTQIVDYNGDGKNDIVSSLGTEDPATYRTWFYGSRFGGPRAGYERNFILFQRDTTPDNLISEIKTQRNTKVKLSYDLLRDARPTGYETVFDAEYPYVNFENTMKVVSAIDKDNGVGGFNKTSYKYGNAKFHLAGRGFQGFKNIIEHDEQRKVAVDTQFFQKFPHSGMVESRTTYTTQSNQKHLLSKYEVTEYLPLDSLDVEEPHCFYPSESKTTTYSLDGAGDYISQGTQQSVVTVNLTKNSYCQTTNRVVEVNEPTFLKTTTTTTTYDNHESGAPNCGLPSTLGGSKMCSKEVESSINYAGRTYSNNAPSSVDNVINKVEFIYNDYWQVQSKTLTANKGSNATGATGTVQSFIYDVYGNLERVSEGGRWQETEYTTDGYFPSMTTNSQWGTSVVASTITTDSLTGQVLTSTDANGLVTTNTYNFIGQILSSGTKNSSGSWVAPPVYKEYNWGETRVIQDGSPMTVSYFDTLGRETRTTTVGFSGALIESETVYDRLGNITVKRVPTPGYGTIDSTIYSQYDVKGRPGLKEYDDGTVSYTSEYTYRGMVTDIDVSSSDFNFSMERAYNSSNQLVYTKDAKNGYSWFAYNAAGLPVYIKDAAGSIIKAEYDGFGRKSNFDDPNMGFWQFSYNQFGEMTNQIDARNISTSTSYDDLGRISTQGSSTFEYDLNKKYGVLSESKKGSKVETLTYNSKMQLTNKRITLDGIVFNHSFAYDSYYGRVKAENFASGEMVAYKYNNNGYLSEDYRQYKDGSKHTFRAISQMTALGDVKLQRFGNNAYQHFEYRNSGALNRICSGSTTSCFSSKMQDLVYGYDSMGNLTTHDNQAALRRETFEYDDLMRIDYSRMYVNGNYVSAVDYSYDAVGNLKKKSDYASNYVYGNTSRNYYNAGPNAARTVTVGGSTHTLKYDRNGNLTSGIGMTLQYNELNKPERIIRNGITSTFNYGADGMRYKQVSGGTTTYYIDKSVTREISASGTIDKTYIGNHTILMTQVSGVLSASADIVHTLTDRLGGVDTLIDGTRLISSVPSDDDLVLQYRMYDAFGRPRNTNAGSYSSNNSSNLLTDWADSKRGFTGHEHLPESELIHMNGRVYDYNLGRFLSVDPFIQKPDSTQSINPYSYIMNNPMAGTDPTGYVSQCNKSYLCVEHTNLLTHANGSTTTSNGEENDKIKVQIKYKDTRSVNKHASVIDGHIEFSGTNQGQNYSPVITGTIEPIVGSPTKGFLKYLVNAITFGIVYGDISSIPSLNADPIDRADIEAYKEQAGAEHYAMAILPGNAAAKATQTLRSLPMQIHHFATNKSKTFTPAMEKIAEKYGLKLDDMWNKRSLPHLGRHPNAYHQFVLDGMRRAHKEAKGNVDAFLSGFDKYVIQPVVNNPELLRKSGWK